MITNPPEIARICHEANRAYCATIGDNSQPTWDDAPQWQRDSALKGVYFHQNAIACGEKPHPKKSHECWMDDKKAAGWVYGPVKDPEKKEHPCMVPFSQLPAEQQMKDVLFCAIVEVFTPKAGACGCD